MSLSGRIQESNGIFRDVAENQLAALRGFLVWREILAEKSNAQALAAIEETASVMQLVADQLASPHLFCEPNRAQNQGREPNPDLGIPQEVG